MSSASEAITEIAIKWGAPVTARPTPTPASLAKGRGSLTGFMEYVNPMYQTEPMHALIGDALERAIKGTARKVIIMTPPQHGKSELASVGAPAYAMGIRPDINVIVASYGASLAEDKSKSARTIVESEEFSELFPNVSTRRDSRSSQHWKLNYPNRGQLKAVGVGGPVTGHGADLIIIDDPFENWERATSITERNRVDMWYRGTLRTRLREGGSIVIIMTRWHEDDLIGRLLQREAGQWEVLRLPAIAESQEERDANNKFVGLPEGLPDPLGRSAGEPLAPKRYSLTTLGDIKADVGSMVWAAEYQQVPRPLEGNWFKRLWFKDRLDAAPRSGSMVRYWDKAGTEGQTGPKSAATAGVLLSITPKKTIIVDVVRGWWSAYEREQVIKETAEKDAAEYGVGVVPQVFEQEPGSGGKESAESTISNLGDHAAYKDIPGTNKDARMQPFAAQAEAGNVVLVRGDWNEDYIEELCTLPNGTRDQADATSGAYNWLRKHQKTSFQQMGHTGIYGDNSRTRNRLRGR